MTVRTAKMEDMKHLGHIMSVSFRTAFRDFVTVETMDACAREDSCIALLEGICREGKVRFLIGENSVLQAHYWALLIMNIFTIGIPLVNVFLFKKRFLQLRLCIVEIILLIGAIILMWYHINQFANKMNAEILYKFSLILPVICIIFTYLAIKGILKDIKLLKSFDRIR